MSICDQVLLLILDGFGHSENTQKNAIKAAHTPHLDSLFAHYPFTTIEPGGEAVGLPKGVAGNSEVGHMNLGAGRPVRQDLVRINEAIRLNTLKEMPRLKELITTAQNGSKRIHLMGLLSDGGVHSHIDHLKAFLDIFKNYPELKIFFHAFMDGRDTPKTNGLKYLQEILPSKDFTFASMQGRSIGMDRDRRWEKIEQAYRCLTGQGLISSLAPTDYIQQQYQQNIFDEFIEPTLFQVEAAIKSEDCVFFLNFRPDRAKEISFAFNDPDFTYFTNNIRPAYYLCMSPYVNEELPHVPILFDKEKIRGGLAEYLSEKNYTQFKIAETEKYAHVTYFFNGGEESPFQGEQRVLVESPREVATYDLKPEMSAAEVTEKLIHALTQEKHTVYVCNFANPDMVGHTGNFEAAVKAVEYIDKCVAKISEVCLKQNIALLITADHGNCDQMEYADGSPQTSHSDAPVPFCLIHPKLKEQEIKITPNCALKDVAPTILHLLGIEQAPHFTGTSIFK
jgi:2,3-bisphosphoglycerate-independent phosphoglycerate mutase